ncbi:MAG: cytochrome c maturation protein CcmE, partial [Halieaceae bacterium]
DLFAEGEGVVASGMLQPDGSLIASEILAKHDENYMPPEVAEALEASRQLERADAG